MLVLALILLALALALLLRLLPRRWRITMSSKSLLSPMMMLPPLLLMMMKWILFLSQDTGFPFLLPPPPPTTMPSRLVLDHQSWLSNNIQLSWTKMLRMNIRFLLVLRLLLHLRPCLLQLKENHLCRTTVKLLLPLLVMSKNTMKRKKKKKKWTLLTSQDIGFPLLHLPSLLSLSFLRPHHHHHHHRRLLQLLMVSR